MTAPHPLLNAADVAAELRAELVELEHEGAALAEEQAALCAELVKIGSEALATVTLPDPAKVATAAYRAALGNIKDRAVAVAARAREVRAELVRYEAGAYLTVGEGVSLSTATLDAVLRGEAPATVAERIMAARVSAATTAPKTGDDPAAALLEWNGTVWGEAPP